LLISSPGALALGQAPRAEPRTRSLTCILEKDRVEAVPILKRERKPSCCQDGLYAGTTPMAQNKVLLLSQ